MLSRWFYRHGFTRWSWIRPPPILPRMASGRYCTAIPEKSQAVAQMKRDTASSSDLMVEAFGTAYATRCQEEGFGGIYGQYEDQLSASPDVTVIESYDTTYATRCQEEGLSGIYDQYDDEVHANSDVMVESFGIAYATRCQEEGFGGTYGEDDEMLGAREANAASEHVADGAVAIGRGSPKGKAADASAADSPDGE